MIKPSEVQVVPSIFRGQPSEEFFSVSPIWSGVDRPSAGGWSAPKHLVERLRQAVASGAACPNAEVKTDVNGKTYMSYGLVILGRRMDADLRRLGY